MSILEDVLTSTKRVTELSAVILGIGVGMVVGINQAKADVESTVNPALVEFHQNVYEPNRLERIGDDVHMSLGFSYANFGFIEGKDGTIMVDAGFFTGNAEKALAAYRKHTDKPISAIIYTHVHGDHRGGSTVFSKDAGKDIPIYAPAAWSEDGDYMNSSLRDMALTRAWSQFGALLPIGPEGTVGSGIGPITRIEGAMEFALPTHGVSDTTELEISGVKIVLIPMYGDIKGHMWVWLPEQKVMFTGDTIMGGTMPYISTARYEPDRKALEFVKSLDQMAQYPVEYVVLGHGRPLIGKKDVEEVATLNRDFAQLLANQVTRSILKGYTADEAIDNFKLPDIMAKHPDMQAHYHRLPWLIRGLYAKRAGWVDDTIELIRLTDSEEIKRLIAAMGGVKKVQRLIKKALGDEDYRWAARLSDYLLKQSPNDKTAMQSKIDAYQYIANSTISANERNYLLTEIKTMKGELNLSAILAQADLPARLTLSDAELLKLLEDKFQSEESEGLSLRLQVIITDSNVSHEMLIRNGVLIYEPVIKGKADAKIKMSHENLAKLVVGLSRWETVIEKNIVSVVAGGSAARQFVGLLD